MRAMKFSRKDSEEEEEEEEEAGRARFLARGGMMAAE
jgi:hypothetical protein